MSNRIVIVDCNCICHIQRYAMQDLSFEERPTGIIFGFLDQLYKLAKQFHPCEFIFAWDSKKNIRKQECPTYKSKRYTELTDEERYWLKVDFNQFALLRTEILPTLGFVNQYIVTGFEADDIIAWIVKSEVVSNRYSRENQIVVSTDQDLYQLLETCNIWNPRAKLIYDREWFVEEYGIYPAQWSRVKAIAGCSSDNIPGVPGVGEVTAIRYLLNPEQPGKKYELIRDSVHGPAGWSKTFDLVHLPHKKMPPLSPLKEQPALSYDGFMLVCDKYGLNSIKNKGKEWNELFGFNR